MYIIRNLHKFAEEDVFADGCQMGTEQSYAVDLQFQAETVDALIDKVASFLDVETSGTNNGVEKRACDEANRIDFAKMEDADGTTPTERQIADWKAGKIKLWYVIYTTYVERVTPVEL